MRWPTTNLSGLRQLLDPRSDVDGVAGDHHLAAPRGRGRDHLAAVDADPDLELRPAIGLQLPVQLDETLPDPQRGAEGTRRVVLVRHRNAEDGHHGVADELLDGAATRLDLLSREGEVGAHELADDLGVKRPRPGASSR